MFTRGELDGACGAPKMHEEIEYSEYPFIAREMEREDKKV